MAYKIRPFANSILLSSEVRVWTSAWPFSITLFWKELQFKCSAKLYLNSSLLEKMCEYNLNAMSVAGFLSRIRGESAVDEVLDGLRYFWMFLILMSVVGLLANLFASKMISK